MRKKLTNFYLSDDHREYLLQKAEQFGITQAEVLRRAIELHKQKSREVPTEQFFAL